MRAIKKPELDVKSVYSSCVSGIQNGDLRSRLSDIDAYIVELSDDYEDKAKNSSLYSIPEINRKDSDLIAGNVNKKELTDLYSKQMVVLNKPARRIYDELLNSAPNGKCPFCGFGHASTLDHYLPKSKFPFFSVLPVNLVPACRDCNSGAKKTKSASEAEDQVLHPYYDHQSFISEQWLFSKVIETSPASITFFVNPPKSWDQISQQRVSTHFIDFGLSKRFSVEAAEELSTLKMLLSSFYNGSNAESVREYLKDKYESEFNTHRNSWKTAMYHGLFLCDWYCNGGFGAE